MSSLAVNNEWKWEERGDGCCGPHQDKATIIVFLFSVLYWFFCFLTSFFPAHSLLSSSLSWARVLSAHKARKELLPIFSVICVVLDEHLFLFKKKRRKKVLMRPSCLLIWVGTTPLRRLAPGHDNTKYNEFFKNQNKLKK